VKNRILKFKFLIRVGEFLILPAGGEAARRQAFRKFYYPNFN
jgi:hypothetical protein